MSTVGINHIRKLLLSSEPEFKDVGMQQLLLGLPDTCHILFEHLINCEGEYLKVTVENLRRHLPFLRPCFDSPLNTGKESFALFAKLRMTMNVFFKSLSDIMRNINSSQRNEFIKRLSFFPGVSKEVYEFINDLWGDEYASYFKLLVKEELNNMVERQLMLFVSYLCNLNCPYCFVKGISEPDMPMDRAVYMLDWAKDNGVKKITFCGGEPTIYPHFTTLLDELYTRHLRTYFATNLLFGAEVLKRLQPDIVDALIVHVSQHELYKEIQWKLFLNNIEKTIQQGISLSMRINMYTKSQDWSHVFHLAELYGIKELQFALTFPNAAADNRFVQVEEFQSMIPSVIKLMERCSQAGIRFVFSKPVPLCLFPEPLRDNLLKKVEYTPVCNVFMDGYTHNACISPGGNVSPCLGMLSVSRPFREFRDWDDISVFCRSEILPLLDRPLLEQCLTCFLYERRLCQGACLGHKRLA